MKEKKSLKALEAAALLQNQKSSHMCDAGAEAELKRLKRGRLMYLSLKSPTFLIRLQYVNTLHMPLFLHVAVCRAKERCVQVSDFIATLSGLFSLTSFYWTGDQ